jgi:hypothetical protein
MSTETVTLSLTEENNAIKQWLTVDRETKRDELSRWKKKVIEEIEKLRQEAANATKKANIYKVCPCVSYDVVHSTNFQLGEVHVYTRQIPNGKKYVQLAWIHRYVFLKHRWGSANHHVIRTDWLLGYH